jgi:phosphate starvation-inducible protein PhoH
VEKYDIKDGGIVTFTHDDIVRSGIVKEFVIAFDKEGGA